MDECDETGVTAALEKICALESRLRQAIQNSHPLSTSFGSDPVAADRERDALLSVGCAHPLNRLLLIRRPRWLASLQ